MLKENFKIPVDTDLGWEVGDSQPLIVVAKLHEVLWGKSKIFLNRTTQMATSIKEQVKETTRSPKNEASTVKLPYSSSTKPQMMLKKSYRTLLQLFFQNNLLLK